MSGAPGGLTRAELEAVETAVGRALVTGATDGLQVIGYGEISCVVLAEGAAGRVACKRLPPFPDAARVDAYRGCLSRYLDRLSERGLRVAPTSLEVVDGGGAGPVAFCLQPALEPGVLLPALLGRAHADDAAAHLEAVVDAVVAAIDDRTGLDAQVSNWALPGGELTYLDVTTPMLRDDDGAEQLDTDLFLASLPWALRGVVRRLLLRSILDTYYRRRSALVDMLGNLLKEGLGGLVGPGLEVVNARVQPAVTEAEVRRTYRTDARMWALLQRLRRLDRWWQRRVRGRTYPFLLPGRIARRV